MSIKFSQLILFSICLTLTSFTSAEENYSLNTEQSTRSIESNVDLSVIEDPSIDETVKLLSRDITKEQFFHRLDSVDSSSGEIFLEDGSVWTSGWWYRSALEKWNSGDRLKITYGTLYSNNIEIFNVDSGESVWCVWNYLPSDENQDFIKRIINGKLSVEPWNELVLNSGWVVRGPANKQAFVKWNAKDLIYIFHDQNNYALLNITKNSLVTSCTLIENEKRKQEVTVFDPQEILKLEEKLNRQVLDQTDASAAVTTAILNYSVGLSVKEGPIAVFLFIGPTGVGKTELAKTLTAELFKTQDALIRFDMSHFSSQHTTERLIGSPPGYVNHEEGGQLTEALKDKPQSIVLLDEIEKAHPIVRKIFLPVFDEGYITDSKDTKVDCKNVIFIMTSNIASQKIQELFSRGYSPEDVLAKIEPMLMDELSPELYNRVQPVLFRPLTESVMERLVDLMMKRMVQQVKTTKNIELIVDDSVYDYLIINGFHPTLGARPLKKLIEKKVTANLAYAIVMQKIPGGSQVTISYNPSNDKWQVTWK